MLENRTPERRKLQKSNASLSRATWIWSERQDELLMGPGSDFLHDTHTHIHISVPGKHTCSSTIANVGYGLVVLGKYRKYVPLQSEWVPREVYKYITLTWGGLNWKTYLYIYSILYIFGVDLEWSGFREMWVMIRLRESTAASRVEKRVYAAWMDWFEIVYGVSSVYGERIDAMMMMRCLNWTRLEANHLLVNAFGEVAI